MPSAVLNTFIPLTHLLLILAIWAEQSFNPHFTDEVKQRGVKKLAQGHQLICGGARIQVQLRVLVWTTPCGEVLLRVLFHALSHTVLEATLCLGTVNVVSSPFYKWGS